MASLKEVKGRINSVGSTRKITSAMKMVASAKLHKAQAAIENMLPYETRLNTILSGLLCGDKKEERIDSPYVESREVKKVAIVAFSSNSSLCGGFNANVIKKLLTVIETYRKSGVEVIRIYPVGRKVAEAVRKTGLKAEGDFQGMADKPSYAEAAELASHLMELFKKKELDKVEMIYHHFRSSVSQVLMHETFLPIELKEKEGETISPDDYIVEPTPQELLSVLLPKVLKLKIFTVLLDSNASEHGARMMAMQTATDNADDLLQELIVTYNKTRQQAITNELLDIMGGSIQQ